MASSGGLRVTNDLFELALGDSLKDFVHIRQLKEEKKRLWSLAEKKDVSGILPTGFGKVFDLLSGKAEKKMRLFSTSTQGGIIVQGLTELVEL